MHQRPLNRERNGMSVVAVTLATATGVFAALPAGAGFGGAAPAAAHTASSTRSTTGYATEATAEAAAAGICTSASYRALAARLSRDILAALRKRTSTVALTVDDRVKGIACGLGQSWPFDSASVVKVTILGALLREAMEQHRHLTATEVSLTTAMITRSDNNAASMLWARLGRRSLQQFLNLAKLTQTRLGSGRYWGLTQITAEDEMILLKMLAGSNGVLNAASRAYALSLMASVIPSQRWGVPAGTPAGVTVHVKNAWLPCPTHGWRIHSIGSFAGHGRDYLIAVLTQDNPTMAYGVRTIENVAEVIHRDLNAGLAAAVQTSRFLPSRQVPDGPAADPSSRRRQMSPPPRPSRAAAIGISPILAC